MTYQIDRTNYSANTVTNTETGTTLTQWDVVTIGKARTQWDVAEILHNGDVRLHRQIAGGVRSRAVIYRQVSMDRLTKVEG
jgi:hypothetical protein